MQQLILAISMALLITSCSKNTETIDRPTEEATYTNLAYGGDTRNKLDLYLPANRTQDSTALIIMIHGGGWTSGDKSELTPYVSELNNRLPGFAVANLNYRLVTQTSNRFPSQENDVREAVRWLLSKREEYQYSDKIILLGVSAGAHLALLQAYKHDDVVKPQSVISFFAPTDIEDMYSNPNNASLPLLLQALFGHSLAQNPEPYQQSSPINFVDQQSAPTLILHGEKDNLVPVRQARMLRDKLRAASVSHQLVIYPDEGHGWFDETLDDSFEKVTDFISTHHK